MKTGFKRILAAAAAVFMLFAAVSCAGGNQAPVDGAPEDTPKTNAPVNANTVNVSIVVEASNAYVHPDLSEAVRSKLVNEGLLISNASVTLQKGSTLRTVISAIAAFSISVEFDSETNSVVSVAGVRNGFCGEGGYWVIRLNGEVFEGDLNETVVSEGDKIELIFTCNGGADLDSHGRDVYTASPATPTPVPGTFEGGKYGHTPAPQETPEPTEAPTSAPGTSSPGDKTSGRH